MSSRALLATLALAFPLGTVAASPERGASVRPATRIVSPAPSVARTPASAAATWCGTTTTEDVIPNLVAGHPVHWVYAVPSDGPDRLSSVGSVMQTDAEAVDAWWRREDPTRTPRNDLRQLPCGPQLDITSLRLASPGDELDSEFNFVDILDGLAVAGLGSTLTKYLVYYDGPVTPTAEGEVCGRGGSLGSGVGLAVVYVQACIGVSTAAVAAHELLHTLGAVPNAAPNGCDGHVCDRDDDLMYPALDDDPLEEKLLDPGRDDYYGHSALFTDTQDSAWLVRPNEQASIRVNVSGPGSVTADVPGLSCTQSCTTAWNAGTALTLTARPAGSSKLVRWSGACAGSGACRLTSAAGATVGALFAPRTYRLTVGVAGRGSVRSARRGISCGSRCVASFASHVPVRLTASPAKGWKLRSWAGACRGTKLTCTVPMRAVTKAHAIFVRAR